MKRNQRYHTRNLMRSRLSNCELSTAASLLSLLVSSVSLVGCSSGTTAEPPSESSFTTGGYAGNGGSLSASTGGNPGVGGSSKASAGSPSTVVNSGVGGSSDGSGGSPSTGGNPGVGGSSKASGGSPSTGGNPGVGGSSKASGGSPSAGGNPGVGGSSKASGGSPSTGGNPGVGGSSKASGGSSNAATGGAAAGSTSTTPANFPFKPSFILGADISWTLEDESGGGKFVEGGVTKPIEQIMANNGFNYIRLRTFVCPSCPGGYSSQGYCDTAHTVTMAKRVKACGMGLQIDFHMADTWVSLGTSGGASSEPSQWAGKTPAQKAVLAHDYVKGVIQALVDAGATPDMVSIGNETNGGMSGIKISDWTGLSQVIAGAVNGVTEVNDKIIITCQNGRPRPDSAGGSNFTGWVDKYLGGAGGTKFRMDLLGGSTYGTTNNGADWTESFGYVIKTYNKPVCSMEYNDTGANKPAGATINRVMRSFPNGMGWGSFNWEPDRNYTSSGTGPLFDQSGKTFTTNAAMAEYPAYAKSIGLPVPSGKCVGAAYGN